MQGFTLGRKRDNLHANLDYPILATCDDSLRGKRDRALLLFAWSSGGRRRSEVAGADMQFLKRVGPTDFIFTLAHSKTNQAGTDQPENGKPVLGATGMALNDWLQAGPITSGAIFRRIRKGGHLGEALSPAAVRTIVKDRCALAGIEGDFSAHSLRSGFVTEATRTSSPLEGGHQLYRLPNPRAALTSPLTDRNLWVAFSLIRRRRGIMPQRQIHSNDSFRLQFQPRLVPATASVVA